MPPNTTEDYIIAELAYIRKRVDRISDELSALRGKVIAWGSFAAIIVSAVVSYGVKILTS